MTLDLIKRLFRKTWKILKVVLRNTCRIFWAPYLWLWVTIILVMFKLNHIYDFSWWWVWLVVAQYFAVLERWFREKVEKYNNKLDRIELNIDSVKRALELCRFK